MLATQTLATMAAYSLPAVAPAVARDLGVPGALVGVFISTVYGVGIALGAALPGLHRALRRGTRKPVRPGRDARHAARRRGGERRVDRPRRGAARARVRRDRARRRAPARAAHAAGHDEPRALAAPDRRAAGRGSGGPRHGAAHARGRLARSAPLAGGAGVRPARAHPDPAGTLGQPSGIPARAIGGARIAAPLALLAESGPIRRLAVRELRLLGACSSASSRS